VLEWDAHIRECFKRIDLNEPGKLELKHPDAIINYLAQNKRFQTEYFVPLISTCPRPSFIAISNGQLNRSIEDESANEIHVEATILMNAVQILLFGPIGLGQDLITSDDYGNLAQTQKRWPLANHPEGEQLSFGRFSIHDVHQAVLLFCAMITRRKNTTRSPIYYTRSVGRPKDMAYLGFAPHNIAETAISQRKMDAGQVVSSNFIEAARDIGDAWDVDEGSLLKKLQAYSADQNLNYHFARVQRSSGANLRSSRANALKLKGALKWNPITAGTLQSIINHAKDFQGKVDVEKQSADAMASRTDFSQYLPPDELKEFMASALQTPVLKNLLEGKSKADQDVITRDIANQYGLGRFTHAEQAKYAMSLEECAQMIGAEYPSLQMFPNNRNLEPLYPHQVLGKYNITYSSPFQICMFESSSDMHI
jgi:hypothetical protein